jgi:hypothetical protein
MKASKFTDAQKAFVIKQGEEGTPVRPARKTAQGREFQERSAVGGLDESELPGDCRGKTNRATILAARLAAIAASDLRIAGLALEQQDRDRSVDLLLAAVVEKEG